MCLPNHSLRVSLAFPRDSARSVLLAASGMASRAIGRASFLHDPTIGKIALIAIPGARAILRSRMRAHENDPNYYTMCRRSSLRERDRIGHRANFVTQTAGHSRPLCSGD